MSEIRTVTCPCISDTFVRRHELIQNFFSAGIDWWVEGENENHGSADRLTFGYVQETAGIPQVNLNTTTQDHRAIMQFDLSEAMVMGHVSSVKLQLFAPSGEGWWGSMLQITPATISGSVIVEDSLVFSRWNQAIRLEEMPMRSVEVNTGAFQVPNPDWIPPFMPEHDPDIPPWIWVETSQTVERGADWVTPERQITPNGGEFDITHLFDRGLIQQNVLTFALMSLGSSSQLITPTRIGEGRSNILTTRFSRESGRTTAPRLILECEPRPGVAPSNLAPTTTQNPRTPIRISWRHERHPSIPSGLVDPQIDSEVEFWQGNGTRTIISGGLENSVELEPNTFTSFNNVVIRARTRTKYNGWSGWTSTQSFPLALNPPLAPTNLSPSEDTQNRRVNINLSWRHTPNPNDWDSQSDSIVEFWQDNNQRTLVRAGAGNRLELPNDTFVDNRNVFWRVQTVTLRNGEGVWSDVASFGLSSFAPQPPIDLMPTTAMNPRLNITLTWRFVANERWFPNDGQVDSEAEVWQGSGARHILKGYSENRAIIPANTFTALAPINFRARTRTNLGGWGVWSNVAQIPLAISPPLAPIDLLPTTPQNPRGVIRVSFTHLPNPEMPNDEQTGAEVRVRQGTGAWRTFTGSAENVAYLPAFTFTSYEQVEFQARTITAINGAGDWSLSERFDLKMTPPLPPELTFPVNIAVLPNNIFLQWSYNSPFDTFPSRFDIRHRINGGAWTNLRTDSAGGLPAANSFTVNVANVQSRLEWQVRAWGALGDVGEWSDIATAFIMGIPQTPIIVQVSNSGRPLITFSSRDAMAWEIEVLQGSNVIYSTGSRAFEGIFTHVMESFIANATYIARLRIINEYGISSAWATRAFTISVTLPQAVELTTANNLEYFNSLRFDGIGRTVYVYRSELTEVAQPLPEGSVAGVSPAEWRGFGGSAPIENDDFTCIAHVDNAGGWEDWTVRPRQRYKYFVRVVGNNFAFADSNVETAIADFKDTTIALTEKPQGMVKLLVQLGSKPTKDSEFEKEKTLTHFAGREKPVLQIGEHTDRVVNLAFHVALDERDRLEELVRSGKVLILRDFRLGVIYGTITGAIRAQASDIAGCCFVTFSFTETDYLLDVKII